jgi:hypothetical protein
LADVNAYTFRVPPEHQYAIVIPLEIGLSLPLPGLSVNKKTKIKTMALVDTGASGSCISNRFAQKFQLKPFSMVQVHSAHGTKPAALYYLDVLLPNEIMLKNLQASEFFGQEDFDFIIGMDILRLCDTAITNANNESDLWSAVFSFRFPPDSTHIDYKKQNQPLG